MAKTASLHIRVNENAKKDAEQIYNSLGVSIAEAVNMFLHKSIIVGGLPFEVRYSQPNAETVAAIQEVQEMKNNPSLGKSYTNVDDMMKELLT